MSALTTSRSSDLVDWLRFSQGEIMLALCRGGCGLAHSLSFVLGVEWRGYLRCYDS